MCNCCKALELASLATQAVQFKDWWWKVQLGKCYYRLVVDVYFVPVFMLSFLEKVVKRLTFNSGLDMWLGASSSRLAPPLWLEAFLVGMGHGAMATLFSSQQHTCYMHKIEKKFALAWLSAVFMCLVSSLCPYYFK